MLAAAVSGTGLEAFGLMVLPYAISVLCTVKRSGNCSLQSDGTGKSVSVYRIGNGRNHLRTCQKSCGVGAEAKATDVCGSV